MKARQSNGSDRPFQVVRDDQGVPQIHAATWLDALFGLGYMHAMDRGTQLLFARSIASGTAAGEISDRPELLETDRLFRRVAISLDLTEEVNAYPEDLRRQLEVYSDGVNAAMRGTRRSLPMWATGYERQPWNPESVLLIGKLLSFGGLAISQMQNERLLVEMIHAGVNEESLRDLFGERLNQVDFDILRRVKISNQMSDEALELMTDLPRLAGSNAWAVSPQRSASGHALLASDPHLEINRLPAIWYEAVLRWDEGRYVMGATLPGCPLFAVARTPELAWGVTYMKGDTVDYFIEDIRPGGESGWQYRRGHHWHDFQYRDESIARKGSEAEVMRVYYNDQGILDADPNESGPGFHLSINWSGLYAGNGRAIGSWLEVVASKSTAEAMDYVQQCPQPTLCWVFADKEGHIGMQGCGRFPIRGNGHVGLAPIPAWDEANHWAPGWLDRKHLPRVYDPPEGFVATANEEINTPGLPMMMTQPLPDYRRRRIVQRLRQLTAATPEDMRVLQYDLVSLQALELLEVFLPHLPDGELKDRLRDWDGSYAPESVEAPLFQKLYRFVMMELLGHEQRIGWRRMLYLCSRAGFSMMVLTAADRVLLRDDSVWWRGTNKGDMIRRAAAKLNLDHLERWSDVNNFHFTDRFFGNHQVGRMLGFNSRRYPMPGNHATIFQGHVLQTATREQTFSPSYHFVTDMGTDEAWTNLPGGPSESRFSRYYRSDVGRWLTGEYKRLSGHAT